MLHMRTNLMAAGWLCMFLGGGIVFGMPGALGLAIAAPLAISGCGMLLYGMSQPPQPKGLSEEEIRDWQPAAESLPPGAEGSVMYRIDTTLDEPKRTSVLCGGCGHLAWVDGGRPDAWTCPGCELELWAPPPEEE